MLVILNRVGYFNFYFLLCTEPAVTHNKTKEYIGDTIRGGGGGGLP